MAATYKNINADFDADCTIVAFAQGNKPSGAHWVECDELELLGFESLYVQGGTRYFGVL